MNFGRQHSQSLTGIYGITQSIERGCACFQEKCCKVCTARAAVIECVCVNLCADTHTIKAQEVQQFLLPFRPCIAEVILSPCQLLVIYNPPKYEIYLMVKTLPDSCQLVF